MKTIIKQISVGIAVGIMLCLIYKSFVAKCELKGYQKAFNDLMTNGCMTTDVKGGVEQRCVVSMGINPKENN